VSIFGLLTVVEIKVNRYTPGHEITPMKFRLEAISERFFLFWQIGYPSKGMIYETPIYLFVVGYQLFIRGGAVRFWTEKCQSEFNANRERSCQ
jgi:hypothetical protein